MGEGGPAGAGNGRSPLATRRTENPLHGRASASWACRQGFGPTSAPSQSRLRLPGQLSTVLRDELLAELARLGGPEVAAEWAHKRFGPPDPEPCTVPAGIDKSALPIGAPRRFRDKVVPLWEAFRQALVQAVPTLASSTGGARPLPLHALALATPIFFRQMIDRVVVHRSKRR